MKKETKVADIKDGEVVEAKTDEERMAEAVEALKAQVMHHNTMLLKAQGALEVLTALSEGAE
mgnify:CR=1 FL=1|tara:strand:- start:573 stop:758 length:186 start_codon:yes stop_codon:yes gene_type:complete